MNHFSISGNYIDIRQERIYPARFDIENGMIKAIMPISLSDNQELNYILPGFIDAHVHIESSMLIPSEFARLAVVHGTVATISDPHEIGNVLGTTGVEFMLRNGGEVPFKFYFGAPSCVPATLFETAGAAITADEVEKLLMRDDILYLSEMMNFPGVLQNDPVVMQKIAAAKKYGKPVDGHAPALRGEEAKKYIEAGISTDHECFSRAEALDKLKCGMKIIIREGSAARNFEALIDLLNDHPDEMMFCSDDKHPDSLVEGHINVLVKRALKKKIDIFKVLKAACMNPVLHYGLPVGLLREGDPADFIVVSNPEEMRVLGTYIDGREVAENGRTLIPSVSCEPVNRFDCRKKEVADFQVVVPGAQAPVKIRVIEALDGQLITPALTEEIRPINHQLVSDTKKDILKLTVVNRYREAPPAVAFIKNFGLKTGAIASSVAHDSHNIIAVGVEDAEICEAVNLLIQHQGGICCVNGEEHSVLPLPVAGLMSVDDGYEVALQYTHLDQMAKKLGSSLQAPFMTLSFMALLVIPQLKLSDQGLFDGNSFSFTQLIT